MTKLYHVQLTEDQRSKLEQIIHSGSTLAQVQTRARILLLAEKGHPDREIAQALFTSKPTVQRTRERFVKEGLERSVKGKEFSGRPPHLTGEVEAHLTLLACSKPPEGRARWTMQLLADRLVALRIVESVSDESVRNMLKKTNSSPGLSNTGAYRKLMLGT